MRDSLIGVLRNALMDLQNYAKVTYEQLDKYPVASVSPEPHKPDHLVYAKSLIIAGTLLVLSHAHAADPAACRTTLDPIADDTLLPETSGDDPDAIIFEVGELEAQFGPDPTASMTGGVILRQADKVAGADAARYDPTQRALLLEGDVRYEDPGTQILSESAEFAYDLGRIRFEGAEFSLGSNNARGSAEGIEVNRQGRLELDDVSYTSCPPGSNDWVLKAGDIDLDTREGIGTARNIKLRFQGVTILYAPYLSFPIGDARKSGILTPEVGSTSRSGNEIRVPYYWNIAPNYDATVTPRLLTDRGLQLQTQFRYLTNTMKGRANVDYLSSDNMFNDSRTLASLKHRQIFTNGWRNLIDIREVSDSQYFEDLGGSLSISSITHLNRSVSFDYFSNGLSFFGQVQDFQTIDDAITPTNEPYRRVPQLLMRGSWPDRWMGTRVALDGELVNFHRDVGVTGWRVNLAPEIALPIERPGCAARLGSARATRGGDRSSGRAGVAIGSGGRFVAGV